MAPSMNLKPSLHFWFLAELKFSMWIWLSTMSEGTKEKWHKIWALPSFRQSIYYLPTLPHFLARNATNGRCSLQSNYSDCPRESRETCKRPGDQIETTEPKKFRFRRDSNPDIPSSSHVYYQVDNIGDRALWICWKVTGNSEYAERWLGTLNMLEKNKNSKLNMYYVLDKYLYIGTYLPIATCPWFHYLSQHLVDFKGMLFLVPFSLLIRILDSSELIWLSTIFYFFSLKSTQNSFFLNIFYFPIDSILV